MLVLHRRAYNLAIEKIRAKAEGSKIEIRAQIREVVREEFEGRAWAFVSVVSDEAVNAAYVTFMACLSKWKKGIKAELQFKSAKQAEQYFVVQKLAANGIFFSVLGAVKLMEEIPKEAFASMARVTKFQGRWFLCVKKQVNVAGCEIQAAPRVIALDPGVRTFLTTFSPTECAKYGDGFSTERLLPLLHKKDRLLAERQKLVNVKVDAQWWFDKMRSMNRRINTIANRVDDLVSDLHRRAAYDLVVNNDVILLPRFETKRMTRKTEVRRIRRRTVREMLNLSFFKFEQHLTWMCKKHGKELRIVTEEYTSKTRSWDGVIHNNLGSAKTISDGKIVVDRDINGARGIFLRASTRLLTPKTDPECYIQEVLK